VHLLALALVLVHGVVMRGPTKPVCEMATPCSEPAAHVALLFSSRTSDVVVRTDARGRYAIRLRPGTYTVRTGQKQSIGRGLEPTRIVVRGPMRADFNIDTGIR
jgi:hypothetical protein